MRNRVLPVVMMLAFLVLSVAPVGAQAQADVPGPWFNWSAGQCLSTQSYEVDFVLHNFGETDLGGTVVEWTGTLNGQSVSGTSSFVNVTGGIAHYRGSVTVPDGDVVWVVTSATLQLTGVAEPLQLANPGATVSIQCRPLGVGLEISATCELATETVRVAVMSNLADANALLTLTHDEQIIAQFRAGPVGTVNTHMDSGAGGEYSVSGGGASETTSINCAPAPPTAVTVATFTAAPSARQCKLTGADHDTACVCRMFGRWRGAAYVYVSVMRSRSSQSPGAAPQVVRKGSLLPPGCAYGAAPGD